MASRNENTRLDLDDEQTTDGPVECLGMTFPSDEARREHFLEILREKLQDPDFRSIEGFPIGDDEDILALSDPPYYTACPNPFIEDFIEHYGTPYDPETDDYHREPFAADVSEGKNDPIYNAHSYHTKVPHKAIMRYILHYTEPGDIVFDGFCGTGMTAVAAEMCGDGDAASDLISTTRANRSDREEVAGEVWQIGRRRAIVADLSPAATFTSYTYTAPLDIRLFQEETERVIREVEEEYGWMYSTLHDPTQEAIDEAIGCIRRDPGSLTTTPALGGHIGRVNYTVWSDVFVCPECSSEMAFWDVGIHPATGKVRRELQCPDCRSILGKRSLERVCSNTFDKYLGESIRQAKQVPVLINYSIGNSRFEKTPDAFDKALLSRISESDFVHPFPTDEMPDGQNANQPKVSHGLTHVHHFYTPRNLAVLAACAERIESPIGMNAILDVFSVTTRMSRFRASAWVSGSTGPMKGMTSGILYVPSLSGEQNCFNSLERKLQMILRGTGSNAGASCVGTGSLTSISCPSSSVDYIFTDPPFGANLMYSELNFLFEAWLGVFTDNAHEAVESEAQGKSLLSYQALMAKCFRECYRVLKPGRWMTVEFHNSQNRVWNAIQEALQRAGFVVADVRTLDKQQGSFKQVTTASAVKQDLVISAYKPNGGLEGRFLLEAGTERGVWDFARTHLGKLAPPDTDEQVKVLPERQDYLLYDRMVAFHVQRGVSVPLSAAEFYAGLRQRFPERDGMFFLPEQVAGYDRKRMQVEGVQQPQLIITDESSAIQWLRQQLREKPQKFQDIQPEFMQQLQVWDSHEQRLELSDILKESFLRYDGGGEVPSQIHSYLSSNYRDLRNLENDAPALVENAKDRWYVPDPNKEADLEKIRHRALMREFEEYRESKGKLKTVRTEALRAGFDACWSRGAYRTIIEIAQRLPDSVMEESFVLQMYYDNSRTRTER